MQTCPRCSRITLSEHTEILPTPPGTDWPPQVNKWSVCSNCGYDSRKALTGASRGSCATLLGVVFICAALAAFAGVYAMADSPFSNSGDSSGPLLAVFGIAWLVIGIAALSGKIKFK